MDAPTISLLRRLAEIRHVALDMDGTIYKGDSLFPETLPFLQFLREEGLKYTFLTNNPSRNNADYCAKLRKLGVEASPEEIYTSAQAMIEFLRANRPKLRRLFLLGTPSMAEAFVAAGFTLLPDDPEQQPDAVIVGFDTTLVYDRLCRAAWWIARGLPYFATNPDLVCPTDLPTVLVDCGSLIAALEKATGRAPDVVFGKPDVAMLAGILRRHGLEAHQLAVVGDRLYTDMAMAQRAGALGVLVLTGETTRAQAAACQPPPDLVVPTLSELGAKLVEARCAVAA